MANRRMVARNVIESDAFFGLSKDAQLLYFHLLIMGADDAGIIGSIEKTIRLLDIDRTAIDELTDAGLLHRLETGRYGVLHWFTHNYIAHPQKTLYEADEAFMVEARSKAGLPYTNQRDRTREGAPDGRGEAN